MLFIRFHFRVDKDQMLKLHKLLTDSSKARRHLRRVLNIQITLLAWFVEFVGFFVFVLGSYLLGEKSSLTTFILQILSYALNFIIVPCIFLINNDQFKTHILESKWYQALIKKFSPLPTYQNEENDEEGQQADAGPVGNVATP